MGDEANASTDALGVPLRMQLALPRFGIGPPVDDRFLSWMSSVLTRVPRPPQMNLRFLEACTPGYCNNEGKPSERSVKNGSYGAGSLAFIEVLEDRHAEGSLAGLELA